jgi:hypothetical protein
MFANPRDQSIKTERCALTIREAADAAGITSRSVRRRLTAGAFPGAYKDSQAGGPDAQIWRIPVEDLEAAGIGPLDFDRPAGRDLARTLVESSPPTAATLLGTDRFARLRSELAEAVASAEVALLRAEAEKWRAVAEERNRALERADTALQTLAMSLGNRASPDVAPPASPTTNDPQSATSAVPQLLRSEAALYAEVLSARLNAPRKPWWRRRP